MNLKCRLLYLTSVHILAPSADHGVGLFVPGVPGLVHLVAALLADHLDVGHSQLLGDDSPAALLVAPTADHALQARWVEVLGRELDGDGGLVAAAGRHVTVGLQLHQGDVANLGFAVQ